MSRPWSDSTKRLVAVGLTVFLLGVVYRFRALLPPLALAVLIAYILTPLVDVLSGKTRLPRSLAVLLVDLVALAFLATIPAVVAPVFISELRQVDIDAQALLEMIVGLAGRRVTLWGTELNLQQFYEQMSSALRDLLQPVISRSLFVLIDVATGLFWVLFVFVVSFYLMRDWHRVVRYLHDVVPADYRHDYECLTAEIGRIWHSFFRGQVMLSTVVAVFVSITMAIVGVPNALVLGLLAGLLEVVPNVGPVLAAIPAVLLALLQGSSWIPLPNLWFALLVIGVYVVIQQVENNYLSPRILGGSVHLHPLVVLIGALAGARLAGVLGIFLAAPVLGSLRVMMAYVYAKLLDVEPFPAEEEDRTAEIARARVAGEARRGPGLTPLHQFSRRVRLWRR